MAYTNIDDPTLYFNTVLYTGNGSTQSITGVGFQPDWTWIKTRSTSRNHQLFDSVRGATEQLFSNLTNAESTNANSLTSFDSDGFSVGNASGVNGSGETHAAWNWLAGGTGVSNTQGSITSTVSANTTSGFSIVQWTGTSSVQTIGHGLGVAPKVVIIKNYGDSVDLENWRVGHSSISSNFASGVYLNTTDSAWTQSGVFNNTAPTSLVFTVGTFNSANGSGDGMIAYCFAEKKGFSKFGKYTGNGSANGPFVYTGFKPAWVVIKRTDSATDWVLYDTTRDEFNPSDSWLNPNTSGAETTGTAYLDILSNGFKWQYSGAQNASGGSYIYMAFAESPFVTSTGIPTTAR